jgi:hypothetical protein
MDSIVKVSQAASLVMSRLSGGVPQARPAPITTEALPSTFVRSVDRDIPDRVVAFWEGSGEELGAPMLRRPLRDDERAALQQRARELQRACEPAPPTSRETLITAISAMLGAFPTMLRYDQATSEEIATAYLWTVREAPHWAVIQAVEMVRSNKAGLNPSFCPPEPDFATVVNRCVAEYRRRLKETEAILQAKVDAPPERRLTAEEIAAKLGRPIGERPQPELPPTDGTHMARVLADLDRRKADREAQEAAQ